MAKKNAKVIRYRKPIHINVGLIIFLIIFLYLAYSVVSFLVRDKIQIYEVGEVSSLVGDDIYTGLILRDEVIHTSEAAGYVNFYVREDSRAAVDSVIYSLDENGQFTEMLNSETALKSNLSKANLSELKRALTNAVVSYDNVRFYEIYDLKYSLENKLLGFISTNSLEDLEKLGIDTQFFRTVQASQSGIVEYYVDGYESMSPTGVTADDFQKSNYNGSAVRSGQFVESSAPVYKTLISEVWSIMIQLPSDKAAALAETDSVKISFPEKDISTTVSFELVTGADGGTYGKLSLSKYMVQFAGQRYLEIQLMEDTVKGLKIPRSSVISQDYYKVPAAYYTTGGNAESKGFQQENYSADGTKVTFVTPTIYYATDEYYYLDPGDVQVGAIFVMPDSSERFTVGETETLQGVFNVNKGYAVFKMIQILDENSEYYIVRRGMDYSLSVYDHILLDGSLVQAGETIY